MNDGVNITISSSQEIIPPSIPIEQKQKSGSPRNISPMFFSVDTILQKSLYVLEINHGYTSGYESLGEDMTLITYLQSCVARQGPVIIVCAEDEDEDRSFTSTTTELSTYKQLKTLAKEILTEEQKARVHFQPYRLRIKNILRGVIEQGKGLSTLKELEQEVFLKENKNEDEYGYDSDDEDDTPSKLLSKFTKALSEANEEICEDISYLSIDLPRQGHEWAGFTPTVIVIGLSGPVTAISLRKPFQKQGINCLIDSATIAFELQCHDKALQRVSQKAIMPPAELLDIRMMCQMAYLNHVHAAEVKTVEECQKLWKECFTYFGEGLYDYEVGEEKSKEKLEKAKMDLRAMGGIFAKKTTIRKLKSNRDRIKEETTQYFKFLAQSVLQKLEHQAKGSKIPVSQVILKPTDGCQGQGVIICPADEEKLAALLCQLAECALSSPADAINSVRSELKQLSLLPEIAERDDQDKEAWLVSYLKSVPTGAAFGDNLNIKLRELYTKTARNTGFFLIEQWIPGEPIAVSGGKKLPTWRFIVETIDNQLTVKPMKEGSKLSEQERRIFGKLPLKLLTDEKTPTTASCVSFIPHGEIKNVKLEDQAFLPDQKLEKELLEQFAKIQPILQKSLQASFFEYLEDLAQSPLEYQQHFQHFILSEIRFYNINFTDQDIKEVRRFLDEKNISISQTLRETLTKIITYSSSKHFKLPSQITLLDKCIVEQHLKKMASLKRKMDRLREIKEQLYPESPPMSYGPLNGYLGVLFASPSSSMNKAATPDPESATLG